MRKKVTFRGNGFSLMVVPREFSRIQTWRLISALQAMKLSQMACLRPSHEWPVDLLIRLGKLKLNLRPVDSVRTDLYLEIERRMKRGDLVAFNWLNEFETPNHPPAFEKLKPDDEPDETDFWKR